MKLGIFTDSHYSSQEITCGRRYNSRSLEKIRLAYEYFEEQKCDLVVCLGDLTDVESTHEQETENLIALSRIINASPLKTVCMLGNHDGFSFTAEEFYRLLNSAEPDLLEIDGKTLIFVDACYFKSGEHYQPGDSGWMDTFYPHTEKLAVQLSNAAGDVYIFMHQNIDPAIHESHRLYNTDEMNRIIRESGKVKAVFQGHYHAGAQNVYDGIKYTTFPAMCENDDARFVVELT